MLYRASLGFDVHEEQSRHDPAARRISFVASPLPYWTWRSAAVDHVGFEFPETFTLSGEDVGACLESWVVAGDGLVEGEVDQGAQGLEILPQILDLAVIHLVRHVFELLEDAPVGVESSQFRFAFAEKLCGDRHRAAFGEGDPGIEAVVEDLPDHDQVCLELRTRVHGRTFIGPKRYVETDIPSGVASRQESDGSCCQPSASYLSGGGGPSRSS